MSKSLIFLTLTLSLAPSLAGASPKRRPFMVEPPKSKVLVIDRYHTPVTVERRRFAAQPGAVFSAVPAGIEDGACYQFRIVSVGPSGETERWRCFAEHNVSECLPGKLAVPYLDDDDKVVLEVTAFSSREPAIIAELEAKRRAEQATADATPSRR